MNILICKCLLGCDVDCIEVLIVLDEYVNMVFVGFVIVFGLNYEDLVVGDVGVFCFFGVGYLIGLLVICK